MQAEIITIGNEILTGQVVDSNAAYIARELNTIGISVYQITSVQDQLEPIVAALKAAGKRSALVLLTGGLGSTKDDVTKSALCRFFQDELVQNKVVLAHIEEFLQKYSSSPISELNRKQAWIPSQASVLHNPYGTTPGLWIRKENTVYVSLSGLPLEMRPLLTTTVLPKLAEEYKRLCIVHRTLVTYGLAESDIANTLEAWENNLPSFIQLAYLPGTGKIRLRLTAKGADRASLTAAVATEIAKLYPLLGDFLYGEEEKGTLEKQIGQLLTEKQLTLATAESCTGGTLAQQLTAVPGASAYFKGSVVSYATETKIKVLNIPETLVQKHSVVSEAVAIAMAQNVKTLLNTDFAIATTGNAGPAKGDSEAAVGTVFIGISTPQHTFAHKFVLGNQREAVVKRAVYKAFELLYREILTFQGKEGCASC